jgi:hypothetical protein
MLKPLVPLTVSRPAACLIPASRRRFPPLLGRGLVRGASGSPFAGDGPTRAFRPWPHPGPIARLMAKASREGVRI